jgi:hypothetical protein
MKLWLVAVLLFLPSLAAAQTQPGAAREAPLVVAADASVPAWINGLQVQLAISTGTVDHVTLNHSSVQRIGLSAAPADNLADLVIGGRVVLTGRHGKGWLEQGGRLVRREYYWFHGQERLPLAGTIGPFALPHWRVRVEWPVPATGPAGDVVDLPLIGGIDKAAYGVTRLGRQLVAVGLDVRVRRPLPLVTAATGADLAAELGGRLVGEAWQEEIMLGVTRPVRRLQLDRPLLLGPIRIDAVAVRQGGPRDGTVNLERGQIMPLDAEEDPEIMTVRGRILKQRRATRYIMLTRTQMEMAGCTSLLVDKAELRWRLACAPPDADRLRTPAPGTTPVPAVATAALIEPVAPPAALAELTPGKPLPILIDGQPRRLHLGDGGVTGLRLNRSAMATQAPEDVQRLRDQLEEASRRTIAALAGDGAPPLDMVRGLNPQFPADTRRVPEPAAARIDMNGASAQVMAGWTPAARRLPEDGVVAPAALPLPRLRMAWGQAPADGRPADLALAIADRSHDQGMMGVAAVPGIDTLFVGIDVGSPHAFPLVSMALGRDLERLQDGKSAGPAVRWRDGGGRLRTARPLQLARPLVLGPLQIATVLVEQAPGLFNYLGRMQRQPGEPWPDWPGIAGLERELRLPLPVLRAAGCHELAVDKPGRAWTLRCGPSARPAP